MGKNGREVGKIKFALDYENGTIRENYKYYKNQDEHILIRYLVRVLGGQGTDKWCTYFYIKGKDMTIREALDEAEQRIDKDSYISLIEKVD